MKIVKLISIFLVALMLLSVCSFAAPSTTKNGNEVDNATILEEEFLEHLKKNGIKKENVSFAYYDFTRELEYVYNADRMFEPNEVLKFPLAYIYFKDLVAGKHHLNEDVGSDNLRTVYLRSLTKDYGHDGDATKLLIEKYGGIEQVKRAMYEVTYTKVNDEFFETEKVNAKYLIDLLAKYYSEAMFCSTDYKNMLISPIKQLSPGRYCETYIYDCKITHRYGFSREDSSVSDMGIVNSANPFGFVIQVEGVKDPEEVEANIAEFAYDFNLNYGDLLLSQLTTLPDVPDKEKQSYDASKTYKTPLMITLIVSTVVIAAGITIAYIVVENRKKNQDRLD